MLEAELKHTEALMETNADFAPWVRSQGGPQTATAALFAVFIYTDDPIFLVVGALRMARVLHIWTILCKRWPSKPNASAEHMLSGWVLASLQRWQWHG